MNLLDWYIGRAIASGILFAMLVLLSLFGVLELANELNDVGKGNYSVSDAFAFVALIMPRLAYELFPVAALLGSLGGLGLLANRSELIAMRAAGISLARMVVSLMKTGALLVVFVVLIGEWVAPASEQKAQHLRAAAISDQITLQSRYGFWARDGNAFVNIRKILPGTGLADIFIYEYDDDRQMKKATYAAYAQYDKDHWLLQDISQSEISPHGVTSKHLSQATWSSLLNPGLLSVLAVPPNILPLRGLYRYIEFLRENGQSARSYQVAFWAKLAQPLVILIMLFLSLPFVLGPLREVSIGQRLFLGSLLGTGFFLLNKAVSHVAVVYDINSIFAALFPGFVLIVIAFFALRKIY